MPFKPREGKLQKSNLDMAMTKFRRLKTLLRKIVDLSKTCKIDMNLFVYDTKLVKITEYYTNERLMLDKICLEIDKAKNGPKRTRRNKVLTIKSVDAVKRLADEDVKG